ncbi:MAG: ribbon-helix-helix protein, CopG family [candidate division NC10 bacterium]
MAQKKEQREVRRERGFNVSQPMWRSVRHLAAELDCTASEVIRRAISDYLERHSMGGRKPKQQ